MWIIFLTLLDLMTDCSEKIEELPIKLYCFLVFIHIRNFFSFHVN